MGSDAVSYQYTTDGKMSHATNAMGTMTFTYDDQGLHNRVTYPNGRSIYYGFNDNKQRTFLADGNEYNITYHYNQKKQLVAVRHADTQESVVQFEYNSRGLLSRKTLGNGVYTIFTYVNGSTELSSINNFNMSGALMSFYSYDYDAKGRVMRMTTNDGNWTYDYDPAGQMVKSTDPSGDATEYTYDGRSNRVVVSKNGKQSAYETNNVNQYISFNQSDQFSYDENGNLIRKKTGVLDESYSYDGEGRLVQTQVPEKTYVIMLTFKISLHLCNNILGNFFVLIMFFMPKM